MRMLIKVARVTERRQPFIDHYVVVKCDLRHEVGIVVAPAFSARLTPFCNTIVRIVMEWDCTFT